MPPDSNSPDYRDRRGTRTDDGRQVYRAGGGHAGDEQADARRSSAGIRTRREGRRSRLLAVIVLVLVAVVIALTGVAARGSGLEGSQGDTGIFKLLPITTTTK